MSLHEFQKRKSPNVVQSLFRREIGFWGLWGNRGNEMAFAIDIIIHRQLIQSRAPRSSTWTNDRKNLKKILLVKKPVKPGEGHILVLNDQIFIRNGKEKPYICYAISPRLGSHPEMKRIYSIPSVNSWFCWEVWWPCENNQKITRQHAVLFIVEKPGHTLKSFHFETGKKYKNIHLDPTVKFDSTNLSDRTLILNCVKASMEKDVDNTVDDCIILSCPKLELVSRCKVKKSALGNSRIEFRGEFIFMFTGRRIEICDLNKTIESSYPLEPTGYVPTEDASEGVPFTHIILERPVALHVIDNTSNLHLEMGYAFWPPHCIKKNKLEKLQVIPISELVPPLIDEGLLSFDDEAVTHTNDNLCMHPDQSGRLILTGVYEIRIILVYKENDLSESKLTVQFSKSLARSNLPHTSLRSGMRARGLTNYVQYALDKDLGIMSWDYSARLDIFVLLEFSATAFQLYIYDNQNWTTLAFMNLFDPKGPSGLSLPIDRQPESDFTPSFFSLDIEDGFISLTRSIKTLKQVAAVCFINLLADSN